MKKTDPFIDKKKEIWAGILYVLSLVLWLLLDHVHVQNENLEHILQVIAGFGALGSVVLYIQSSKTPNIILSEEQKKEMEEYRVEEGYFGKDK